MGTTTGVVAATGGDGVMGATGTTTGVADGVSTFATADPVPAADGLESIAATGGGLFSTAGFRTSETMVVIAMVATPTGIRMSVA